MMKRRYCVFLAMLLTMMLTVGNAAAQEPEQQQQPTGVVVKGSVFGGGNNAGVKINTAVNISYGTVEGNVYGGGNLGDVGTIDKSDQTTYNYIWTTNTDADTNNDTGLCTVNITGGTIGAEGTSTANHASGHVFGAGKGATSSFYCEKGMVYKTNVSISKGTVYGNVYGGGEVGRVENDAVVSIDGTNDNDTDIKGGVFGAGAGVATHGYSALVRGNATVTVQGKAKVGMNVYGGGEVASVGRFRVENSLPKEPLSGGNCTVTIQGNAKVGTGSDGGSVYGACKGVEPDFANAAGHVISTGASEDFTDEADYLAFLKTLALTSNTNVTIAGNASVNGSVYGGGRRGITLGAVAVNMTGGTVNQDVYGGGALADSNTGNWNDGYGTVTGITAGTTIVTGYYTRTGEGTTESPYAYTEITDADTKAAENTTYYSKDSWAHATLKSAYYKTFVNILGGKVVHDVYGGGLGNETTPAYVWGDVKVNLNGLDAATDIDEALRTAITGDDDAKPMSMVNGVYQVKTTKKGAIVARVFGCNNVNGTPKGEVLVHVRATQSGVSGKETIAAKSDTNTNTYDVEAVYGGGNQAAYVPASPYTTENTTGAKTQVIIEGCGLTSIETVYGGGNAAAVPETNVDIKGAYEIGYLFGGGNGKDKILINNVLTDNPGADIGQYTNGTETVTYGTGNANTLMEGGLIHEAYGGSNTKGIIKGAINQVTDPKDPEDDDYCCDLVVDKIVGAGKYADIDGDVNMTLSCQPSSKVPLLFAGADEANVNGNITLNITNGHFGKVFGGNNLGGAVKGKITVNVEETGCQPIKIDNLYLGGNEAAYSVYGYYESNEEHPVTGKKILKPRTAEMHAITDPTAEGYKAPVTNPTADATHTFPYAQPELNIISCTYIGNVFGGGLGAPATMYANPTVNINMVAGKHADTAVPAMMTELGLDVEKTAGNPDKLGIIRNVYGGGDAADIAGNTTVNIATEANKGAYIIGSVFGGGNAADVLGNTNVTMSGGYVFNGIFGGGFAGSVGDFTTSTDANKIPALFNHTTHSGCIGKPISCKTGTGKCTVVVNGGQIGPIEVATEGMRRLDANGGPVPQGWVWGGSCGIVADPSSDPDSQFKAYVNETDVTIGGTAFVLESIIGGGEFGRVLGNTKVTIQDHCQIGIGEGKVDTNGNPIRYADDDFINPLTTPITEDNALATCSHFPFGKDVAGKKVYECYDPYADEWKNEKGSYKYPGGVTDNASDGKTWIGCVFGGGSGYMPYKNKVNNVITDYDWVRSAGLVEGNSEVIITGGHILTNVYGGNEYTDVLGKSSVKMSGGTVGVPRTKDDIKALPMCGYIYGAGKGDERTRFNTMTNVGSAEVEVSGGIVYGSVYGGGEDGHVLGDVKVTIKEGAKIGSCGTSYYDGHVFGGGRGFSGIAQTAGSVGGNVTLNIEGGKMLGSVYGGGRLASVGTQFTAPDDDNYGNFVEDDTNGTYGHVTVNISGGTIGKIFTPDAEGNLPAGAEHSGNVFGGSMGRLDRLNGTRNPIWPKMAQVKFATVNISGDTDKTIISRSVYGGGELGTVRDDASVTISGGTVRRDVYGGGYGSLDRNYTVFTVKELNISNAYEPHTYAFTPMQFAGCVGKSTTVNVSGGYIRKSVYGGGEMASVGVINCRAAELTSGTSTEGKVYFHDTESNKDFYYENMVKHADATKEFALSWPYEFNYVDGYEGATHVNITGGRLGLITEGGRFGLSSADTDTGFDDNGDVYGAGKGQAGDYKDFVFCANVGSTDVKIAYGSTPTAYSGTGDLIAGAVYGGGEDGHVMGDTKVTISGGLIYHSVYGGGSGKGKFVKTLDKTTNVTSIVTNKALNPAATPPTQTSTTYEASCYSITAGKVFGNTEVVMTGGTVIRNVYGGGNMGSVGKGNYAGGEDDYSTNGYGEKVDGNLWDGSNKYSTAFLNSGKCTVKISGGTIGYIDTTNPSNSMYPKGSSASLPYGNVFGGCRGESAPNISEAPRYLYSPEFFVGYANETSVTIEGENTTILGSVYGGGMDGHVRRDASVTITGGKIGIPFDATNKTNVKTEDPDNIQWLARGNVYGAGSGIGKYKYDFNYDGDYLDDVTYNGKQTKEEDNSTSAGSVTRFTKVEIKGGNIYRNVYGGGSLASVGAPKIGQTYDEYRKGDTTDGHGQGKQTMNEVIIAGGKIGGAYSYDATGNHVYGGMVYGGSRGNTELSNAFSTSLYTAVNIIGDADVKGDVYGGGEAGAVKGDVDVNVASGTIGHDVYGGGALADTQIGNWNATANENAGAWVDADKESALYQTKVNILGGSMRDVYGGGLGRQQAGTVAPVEAKVYGDVYVNLNGLDKNEVTYDAVTHGTTTGEGARLELVENEYLVQDAVQGAVVKHIFGCNNLNGSPQGKVKVHVFKTQRAGQTRITNPAEGDQTAKVKVAPDANGDYNVASFDVQAVYGGGNMAAYVPKDLTNGKTQVVIDGCDRTSIGQVYGGGNAASTPATEVTVNETYEIGELFGGGNGKDRITIDGVERDNPGANVGFYDYSAVETTYPTKQDRQTEAFVNNYVYGSGKANVNIFGGTVHRVFGGSNTKGNVRQSAITMLEDATRCEFCVDEAYGGGKSAPMDAEAKLLMSCIPGLKEVYGGAQAADVYDNVTVNITNGTFDRVFGGNNLSGTIRGTITVNIEETGCRPVIIGELYGGGNQAGYSVYGYNSNGGLIESGTTPLYADPQVNVRSFTSIGTIYGGGYGAGATMVGNPTVNINVANGKYYDSDRSVLGDDAKTAGGYPVPSHAKNTIGAINNVFGGGNAAKVIGSTNVNIGTEDKQTFVSIEDESERVKTVVGADIRGNVYGGGNNAEVTGNTNVVVGKERSAE